MKRSRGYSLIEVFICILLVAGVFFAIATVFPTSLSCLRKSQSTITAQYLAQQYMESYRNMDFTTVLAPMAASGAPTVLSWPTGPPPPGWDGITYSVMITVANAPIQPGMPDDGNLVQLDVQVLWNSGSMTGNTVSTDAQGVAVPVYADSSVHDSTVVFDVLNPF